MNDRALYTEYFGTDQPNVTGPNCNVCGVDIGPWGTKKERHISFHEGLKPTIAPVGEGIWTMTDTEFYRELARAWQEGSTAERRWWIKVTKNEDAIDPENPYTKGLPS